MDNYINFTAEDDQPIGLLLKDIRGYAPVNADESRPTKIKSSIFAFGEPGHKYMSIIYVQETTTQIKDLIEKETTVKNLQLKFNP